MITIKKEVYVQEFREATIEYGTYYVSLTEDDIISLCKLELNENGYKFTRLINDPKRVAIIVKEDSGELPWVMEKYFLNDIKGNEIEESEFLEVKGLIIANLQ